MTLLTADQGGLRYLDTKAPEPPRQPQVPPTRLQVYKDASTSNDLPNLPAVQSGAGDLGKSLSRLAEPVVLWDTENVKAPIVRVRF